MTPDQPGNDNAGNLITASSQVGLDQLSTQLTAEYSASDQRAIAQILAQIENLAGAVSGGAARPPALAGEATVNLYRAVSPAEFNDIMSTGTFRSAPGAFEGKQFGLSLEETLGFANSVLDTAAIIRATIPQSTFGQLEFSNTIDPFIFKSGVVTARPGAQLKLLNSTVISIEHAY